MSVTNFDELIAHKQHEIGISVYSDYYMQHNVAIECYDCSEVLLDFDRVEDNEDEDATA